MLKPRFQPGQIVSLSQGHNRLYAEVIQLADQRDLCWIRPIVLEMGQPSELSDCFEMSGRSPRSSTTIDLRDGIDLLVPPSLLQSTLDTDFIPLLAKLTQPTPSPSQSDSVKEYLKQFIHLLCQRIRTEDHRSIRELK